MGKRGELSSQQIVMIVLAIAGFVIVSLFLWGLYAGQDDLTEREICHLSVVQRATLPIATRNAVPFQCTTEKICISENGKKDACKEQYAGEENVRAVKLKGNSEERANIIERESANAMYDCWTMMGEGKLEPFTFGEEDDISWFENIRDIVGLDGFDFEVRKPQCVICSRVAIAQDVCPPLHNSAFLTSPGIEEIDFAPDINCDSLKLVDVNRYLAEEQVPGSGLTYLQTFTDKSVSSYAGVDKVDKARIDTNLDRTNEMAYVFTQIKTDLTPTEAATSVVFGSFAVGGTAAVGTGVGRKAIGKVGSKGGVVGLLVTLAAVGGTAGFAAKTAYDSQQISAAHCKGFEVDDEKARVGCSIVKGVEWDTTTINSLCSGGIEGNL
jgi:hypothetical protein